MSTGPQSTAHPVAIVVDDSQTMRELVGRALTGAGFRVVTAGDGQEALDRLANHQPDLIITDVNMPVMDGITFVREARRKVLAGIPILVLTTETSEEAKQQGRQAGATGWLTKPFRPERLMQVLARLMPHLVTLPEPAK